MMNTYYNTDTIIFQDGEYVKAAAAKMDLYSQSLHYGYAVFEGMRSYRAGNGYTRIFKEVEHFVRLKRSAEALNIPLPFSVDEMIDAAYVVLERNQLQNAYIRPIIYLPANMTFNRNEQSHFVITAWKMAPFLGDKLLRVMTSSFERPNPKAFRIHAKSSGLYVNSILASQEAKSEGFDEALLTDMNGFVAEGPGANMFFEKDGKLFTPATGNILPGITRATVIEMCHELGIPVEEGQYTIDELKQADAAFFCGTAAEIIGWESLDEYKFPLNWSNSLGSVLQSAYAKTVLGDKIQNAKIKFKNEEFNTREKATMIGSQ